MKDAHPERDQCGEKGKAHVCDPAGRCYLTPKTVKRVPLHDVAANKHPDTMPAEHSAVIPFRLRVMPPSNLGLVTIHRLDRAVSDAAPIPVVHLEGDGGLLAPRLEVSPLPYFGGWRPLTEPSISRRGLASS